MPIGFAHGFVTLEPDTEVLYKVTTLYSPQHDRGLAIDWPAPAEGLLVSEKDRRWPRLRDLSEAFP